MSLFDTVGEALANALISMKEVRQVRPMPVVYGTSLVTPVPVYKGPTFPMGVWKYEDNDGDEDPNNGTWVAVSAGQGANAVLALCEKPLLTSGGGVEIRKAIRYGQVLIPNKQDGNLDGFRRLISPYWVDWSDHTDTTYFSTLLGRIDQTESNADLINMSLQGTAYFITKHLALNEDGTIPDIKFEVRTFATGEELDADPADVVIDLLTNTRYGAGLPASAVVVDAGIDGSYFTGYRNYCRAEGWRVSRTVSSQEDAASLLDSLLFCTNSRLVQSDGKLKVIPLCDSEIVANGTTYTPPTTSVTLDADEFVREPGQDPITVVRTSDDDVFNCWPVRILNRSANYKSSEYEAEDVAHSAVNGPRRAQPTDGSWLATPALAVKLSSLLARRSISIRNTYKFTLKAKWAALECMDYVTLSEPITGLAGVLCRIESIRRLKNGDLEIEASEAPEGSASAIDFTPQAEHGFASPLTPLTIGEAKDAATQANDALALIADEDYLTQAEKASLILVYKGLLDNKNSLVAQASTFGVSSVAYAAAIDALQAHMVSLGLTLGTNDSAWLADPTDLGAGGGSTLRTKFYTASLEESNLRITLANAAMQAANDAAQAAADAENAAGDAALAANGKNRSYYQPTAPTGTLVEGDLWFDTDDGYKLSRWSGSAWVSARDTTIATAQTTANTAVANAATAQAAAEAAQDTADAVGPEVTAYVQSRGMNLIANGTGLLGDNTNFSTWVFTKAQSYGGSGSFYSDALTVTKYNDEYIPVEPGKNYDFRFWMKAETAAPTRNMYAGSLFFDVDKNQCHAWTSGHYPASNTTLAAPLKPGDTTIQLTSGAGWTNAANTFDRGVIIWGYKNAGGYKYPDFTYSRHAWSFGSGGIFDVGGVSGNTVTLKAGTSIPASMGNPDDPNGEWPIGTPISQGRAGNTSGNKYFAASNVNVPLTWTEYRGKIGGLDLSGSSVSTQFPPGSAYMKLMFLLNRDTAGVACRMYLANVWLSDAIQVGSIYTDSINTAGLDATVIKTGYLDANRINANTIAANKLNFTPAQLDGSGNLTSATKILASINASTEGIKIAGSKIQIDGTVTFSAGYDPSSKATPAYVDQAEADAVAAAAADATSKASAAQAAAISAAQTDAQTKAAAAQAAAIAAAAADATAKAAAAEGNATAAAEADAAAKAAAAQAAATAAAAADAANKVGDLIQALNGGIDRTTTTIDGGRITTGFIDADRIQAGTIVSDHIAASGIDAGVIKTGYLGAARIQAGSIDATKLTIGSGKNLLYNSDFSSVGQVSARNNPVGWNWWTTLAFQTQFEYGVNLSADWTLGGDASLKNTQSRNTAYCNQIGRVGDNGDKISYYSDRFDVMPGQRYIASGYVSAHRCLTHVEIRWFDAAGALISTVLPGAEGMNDGIYNPHGNSGKTLEEYQRLWVAGTAPSNAVKACVEFHKYDTKATYADSWMFVCRTQIEEAAANQTGPSPWSASAKTIIDGGMIQTGTLVADNIKAGTITVDKMSGWLNQSAFARCVIQTNGAGGVNFPYGGYDVDEALIINSPTQSGWKAIRIRLVDSSWLSSQVSIHAQPWKISTSFPYMPELRIAQVAGSYVSFHMFDAQNVNHIDPSSIISMYSILIMK